MATYIDGGLFSYRKQKFEPDRSNRCKFFPGAEIVFTELAIQEGIYKDYMTPAEAKSLKFMTVIAVNNYPDGRGSTGQWVKTDKIPDWIDVFWFDKYIAPKPSEEEIRAKQDAAMKKALNQLAGIKNGNR